MLNYGDYSIRRIIIREDAKDYSTALDRALKSLEENIQYNGKNTHTYHIFHYEEKVYDEVELIDKTLGVRVKITAYVESNDKRLN